MRKKRIIIPAVVVLCVLVGVFFVMKFDVIGKIYNFIQDRTKEEVPEELKYETFLDKDGNEYVVEMRKIIVTNLETGEEVEMWEDTSEPKIIYDNYYKGKIEKIEDNKIYFNVDKEDKSGGGFSYKDVEDYKVVFDIDTYDLESDPHSSDYCDSLNFDHEDFYSAKELEFLVGKDLRVQESMFEDYYTKDRYKMLFFQ